MGGDGRRWEVLGGEGGDGRRGGVGVGVGVAMCAGVVGWPIPAPGYDKRPRTAGLGLGLGSGLVTISGLALRRANERRRGRRARRDDAHEWLEAAGEAAHGTRRRHELEGGASQARGVP